MLNVVIGLLVGFMGYAYVTLRPPPPKICGSPGGPPVTSPRTKLRDGRHLAYKERGVSKEEAKFKIIISHGFGDSKDFHLPLSEEFIQMHQIYLLSFDRAGYGESDPNPKRSVKLDALDIEELADNLLLGPKFYIVGISMGAYPAYGCMKYIPHRLSGVALVVPFVHYWWPSFPSHLSKEALGTWLVSDQRTFTIAHYAPPWLLHWWLTQKWFPSFSMLEGNTDSLSPTDLEIIKQSADTPDSEISKQKVTQQGAYESLHRDLIVGFGNWGFDPTHISNPFPNNEGAVHLWQGYEDKVIPIKLNRFLSQKLPWIRYHEVRDAGHLMILLDCFYFIPISNIMPYISCMKSSLTCILNLNNIHYTV